VATVPVYNNQNPRGTPEDRPVVEGNDLAAGVIEKLPADLDERLAAVPRQNSVSGAQAACAHS
jgi:hypothetical protein